MQNDTTLRPVPLMRKSQDTYILKTCSFEAKEVGSGSRGIILGDEIHPVPWQGHFLTQQNAHFGVTILLAHCGMATL